MRILINAGRLTWSTPTTYAQGLVRGLQERGHEVQVAGLGGPLQESFRSLGPEVYEVHRDFFSFRRFVGFVREFDPQNQPVIVLSTGKPMQAEFTVSWKP